MSDRASPVPPALPRIARLLPARLRERVFEPAWHDLLAERRGNTGRLGWRVALLALDSLRVGSAGIALAVVRARNGRLVLLAAALIVFVVTFLLTRNYGPQTPYVPRVNP